MKLRCLLLAVCAAASSGFAVEGPSFHIAPVEVTARGGVWALQDDLLANARYFHVSPVYSITRRNFMDTADQLSDFRIVAMSVDRERPWSEQELDGARVHFVWLRDGRIEWVRELDALPKFHASGARPAQAVRVMDGSGPLAGSPAIAVSKDGVFLEPRPWFSDSLPNRVAFKIVAGIDEGLAADIGALENPDLRSSLHAGVSLAHLAAEAGHVGALQALTLAGADLAAEEESENAPLVWAAAKDRVAVVEWLLEQGVRPRSNQAGLHPIEEAVNNGHMQVAAALYRHAKTKNFRDEMLGGAAWAGNRELSRALLAEYSDFRLYWIDPEPLWWIAQSPDVDLMREMLDRGLPVGRRPFSVPMLNLAARSGNVEMVRLLVDRGAKVESRDVHGKTALIEATLNSYAEVAALLIERGADPAAKDKEGRTALDYATQRKDGALLALFNGEAGATGWQGPVLAPWQVDKAPRLAQRPEFALLREGDLDVQQHYEGRVVKSDALSVGGAQILGVEPGQSTSASIVSWESTEHYAYWSGIVEPDGTVSHVRVLSAGPGRFRASVEGAVGDYRFEPGIAAGEPVRTRIVWLEDLR